MDFLVYVLIPQILHGLVWGMVIALIALGLTIVFGILDVVNFAHGELYMLGAFFGYSLLSVVPNFWAVLCIAVVAVGLLGIIIEVSMFRPLYGRNPVFHLLLTFGLGMILREVARLIWGGLTRTIDAPVTGAVHFLDMVYPTYRLVVLGISIVILIAVFYGFNRTETGAIIRAASHDKEMARALGINVTKIYTLVFSLGAALAALAGVLMGPIFLVYPTMGMDAILRAFIVVIVGGMGSVVGAVVAAIVIGEVESLFSLWVSPTWAETLVFGVLILSMVLRPGGLFGQSEAK
jgi:branched-chain amino acid transport system permease protein